jgi:hypothetical protein
LANFYPRKDRRIRSDRCKGSDFNHAGNRCTAHDVNACPDLTFMINGGVRIQDDPIVDRRELADDSLRHCLQTTPDLRSSPDECRWVDARNRFQSYGDQTIGIVGSDVTVSTANTNKKGIAFARLDFDGGGIVKQLAVERLRDRRRGIEHDRNRMALILKIDSANLRLTRGTYKKYTSRRPRDARFIHLAVTESSRLARRDIPLPPVARRGWSHPASFVQQP